MFGNRKSTGGIAAALESLVGGMQSATKVRESLAMAYWDRVVGGQAAAASEPESVREGVLYVRTKSSVWSHELTFLQGNIISQLNKRVGKAVIRQIVFRAQGIDKGESERVTAQPSEADLAAIMLTPAEQQTLDEALSELDGIENKPIRDLLAQRLYRERKLYRWRL